MIKIITIDESDGHRAYTFDPTAPCAITAQRKLIETFLLAGPDRLANIYNNGIACGSFTSNYRPSQEVRLTSY